MPVPKMVLKENFITLHSYIVEKEGLKTSPLRFQPNNQQSLFKKEDELTMKSKSNSKQVEAGRS